MLLARRILLVTGLKREARIVGGDGTQVVIGGGHSGQLARAVDGAVAQGVDAVLSMGIAGGLSPGLMSGTVIVASAILANKARLPTETDWCNQLHHAIPGSITAAIAGVDHMIAGVSEKAALHQASGAAAVDMESHIAAEIAARYAVPFAAIRVIADPANRGLPPAAQAGLASDGRVHVAGVMRSLAMAPWQIPALVQTGLDAGKAFRALARCRRLVGPGFCFPDFSEFVLDVP